MAAKNNQPISGQNSPEPEFDASMLAPFTVHAVIEGVAPLLFHAWSVEDVEDKAAAPKGSKTKKTDNIEAFVYRNKGGEICMPSTYLQRSIQEAARYEQDPRSPRKSAMDITKAGVLVTPLLTPMLVQSPLTTAEYHTTSEWDFLHRGRVVVQRAAVNRTRPAYQEGWRVEFDISSILPEYIGENFLRKLVVNAGRLIGLADFRPSYGRFDLVSWTRMPE